MSETSAPAAPTHFIAEIVQEYLAKNPGATITTRFPPEPNGYLHIGHAKSICLNFGLAKAFGGHCHLRMDDTNPTKEEVEYVESIQHDVRWLGFAWHGPTRYASGYFEQIHGYAVQLIKQGDAYVCDLSQEEIAGMRGTPTEPARPSPFRDRPVAESLDLFERMTKGEFADGVKTVRAKIDLASPNMHMRDPVIYRIRHAHHHQTGGKWCVYPMYDYAHCLSDAIEGITHSICTLEFEVHRPLYDWILHKLNTFPSHQYEFSRLNLTYTVMSKRKLLELVKDNHVAGWDDPRLPTISGLRRRGVPSAALRRFCEVIGVTKFNGLTDVAVLENSIRENLNKTAPRFMAVFHPLKVVLTNWPADRVDTIVSDVNPEDPSAGSRLTHFTRELYIERDDFLENPPKKFFRLSPGGEVRLRHGYVIRCDEVVKDAAGNITELRCTCDLDTKSGTPGADAKKVKGVIHWVPAPSAVKAQVRLYDRLFTVPEPDAEKDRDFKEFLNPDSLKTTEALLEPDGAAHLAKLFAAGGTDGFAPEVRCQFERVGYFMLDPKDNVPGQAPVFNRIVTLKDSWAKEAAKA